MIRIVVSPSRGDQCILIWILSINRKESVVFYQDFVLGESVTPDQDYVLRVMGRHIAWIT